MRQFFLAGVGFLNRSQTLTSWIPAQPQRTLSTTTEPPAAPPHTGQILLPLENTSAAGLNGCKDLERARSSSNIHCFRQCCGSALVSLRIWIRIRIQHFLSLRIRIQIQGFYVQKLEQNYRWKKCILFQAAKLEFSSLFWVILAILDLDPDPYSQCGSGSSVPKWMRIRIRNTGFLFQLPSLPPLC